MITSGGVCAVLDYEIDQMTEYVAEMTQRLIRPSNTVLPSLREFVSDLLSSTRLPSTTILLGMHYLARRTNHCNSAGFLDPTESQVCRMLTIGLLLGSKFLDDNTFQNRSWSEVSGIPVADINKSEAEWLTQMDYCIYVNLDENVDFIAWMGSWDHWRSSRNVHPKSTLDRLAPLAPMDPHVHNAYRQNYCSSGNMEGANPVASLQPPPGFGRYIYNKNPWTHPVHSHTTPPCLTPPLAADSGLNTPVYMNLGVSGPVPRFNDWTNFDSYAKNSYSRGYQSQNAPYRSTQIAAYHTPVYHCLDYQYNQSVWNHSPICSNFGCYTCSEFRNPHGKKPSFFSHSIGHQIMAG